MATKKAGGSSKNGRDSEGRRLGVKNMVAKKLFQEILFIDKEVLKMYPGQNVGMGRDHTIFSKIEGTVKFQKKKFGKTFISVVPH